MPDLDVSIIDRTGNTSIQVQLPDNFTPKDVMKAVEYKLGSIYTDEDDMWPDIDIEVILNMTIVRCSHGDMANWTLIYVYPP